MAENPKTIIKTLPRSPMAYGLVVKYIAQFDPFKRLEFGPIANSLLYQIRNNCNLGAIRGDDIVAYLGWVRTNEETAQKWLEEEGNLIPDALGTVVAINVFAADDPTEILPMIRYAKKIEPGLNVFWKRFYQDGRKPVPKVVRVD